jgi:hypothetical protein
MISGVVGDATGFLGGIVKDGIIYTGDTLNSVINTFNRPDQWHYDVFPEDLGSSYSGHWMTISAYKQSGGVYVGGGTEAGGLGRDTGVYGLAIFMPGAGGQGSAGMSFDGTHRYGDVKLTNVLGERIAGAPSSDGGGGGELPWNRIPNFVGHPINPMIEIMFLSTDLRKFDFVFLMAPSSEKETQTMESIIKNLRKYAAPDINNATAGLFFDSPHQFVIKFYHRGEENKHIPKIRKCVMTNINVNYTPQGDWSTFSNGAPVACMISMTFEEMEIVHKQLIEKGF